MKYIGIDLGTANTYVFGADGESIPRPLVLQGLSDDTGSMATVVMYEDGKALLAGNVAEAEYYSHPGLQGKRRLASQFKPEIALGENDAIEAATDFLRLLREALPAKTLTSDTVVTVGMPALAREDYRLHLRLCFEKAGWPRPGFARESDAALVSCLQSGILDADDIGRKSLIIDFGGGTCDYSSVERLDVLQNGGDILYGGRLFDDLFYQAFCAANADLARSDPSPFAWHDHWLECRRQKEIFSDFIANDPDGRLSLRLLWHDASGRKHEAFLHEYDKESFLRGAENYVASSDLLKILSPYSQRAGLSQEARDLLGGRQVGLLTWLRHMLEAVQRRREVSLVILTGGSCRWYFVRELAQDIFPGAKCVHSERGYEDIAFGLAVFPALTAAHARTEKLLRDQMVSFLTSATLLVGELVEKHARGVARLCSKRIVERDLMPILEAAQGKDLTAAQLDERMTAAIAADDALLPIAQKSAEELRREVQSGLNARFHRWLRENGVPLAPAFEFPASAVGHEFFQDISVKISRLDSINLMAFTIQKILPILAGTATASAIAHTAEPVSTVIGGSAAFGLTWLLARTAPKLLENRRLPAFILNDRNRKKIAESNERHIEEELLKSFANLREQMAVDTERRIRAALDATLGSLSALNQARMR